MPASASFPHSAAACQSVTSSSRCDQRTPKCGPNRGPVVPLISPREQTVGTDQCEGVFSEAVRKRLNPDLQIVDPLV